ncbi:MAG: N-acetylmuramoyl-L-alanine amidase, partial [Mycobacteriaceae bacterium]
MTNGDTPVLSDMATTNLEGKIVFLDPGHNGSNDSSINSQVPNGRGGTKDCQTTGTSTNNGYAEHTFTWKVTQEIQSQLQAIGAAVILSRPDDSSVGPCVDRRAQDANATRADAVVSIHGDGAGPDHRGFHVCYSAPALND